ncbi:hypothetical protein ACVWYG_001399 [Pedobacter sp. UYEF25]
MFLKNQFLRFSVRLMKSFETDEVRNMNLRAQFKNKVQLKLKWCFSDFALF